MVSARLYALQELLMTICPICKSEAESLPRTGYHEAYDCPNDGKFKVGGTVLVDNNSGRNATRTQWEAALKKAKARAKPGEWPLIETYDF